MTIPSRSRMTENVSGATDHHSSRRDAASGPSWDRPIATIASSSAGRAGSTANGWALLGKNASRTTGLSIR